MRQVPRYLIIGNGRLSRHFQHYLHLCKLPFAVWQRQQPLADLQRDIQTATHILLLISDQAIDVFYREHLQTSHAIKIHCSGSLNSDYAYGAHPLMTFGPALYADACYPTIPFVVDHDAPSFDELFPGFVNPHTRLDKSLKAKYHALCVMAGNFSCLLWQKLFANLESELQIPKEFAHLYLQQQTTNLINDAANALTGPLVRNDQSTIEKNIAALTNDSFQPIYQQFVSVYQASIKAGEKI